MGLILNFSLAFDLLFIRGCNFRCTTATETLHQKGRFHHNNFPRQKQLHPLKTFLFCQLKQSLNCKKRLLGFYGHTWFIKEKALCISKSCKCCSIFTIWSILPPNPPAPDTPHTSPGLTLCHREAEGNHRAGGQDSAAGVGQRWEDHPAEEPRLWGCEHHHANTGEAVGSNTQGKFARCKITQDASELERSCRRCPFCFNLQRTPEPLPVSLSDNLAN